MLYIVPLDTCMRKLQCLMHNFQTRCGFRLRRAQSLNLGSDKVNNAKRQGGGLKLQLMG